MEVESTAKIQYIQSELSNFAHNLLHSGRYEDNLLDAFTVLLASRAIENLDFKTEFHENVSFISRVVSGFVNSICSSYNTHINFEHLELHRLFYFCNRIEVTDLNLIDILDWMVSSNIHSVESSSTPIDLADLLVNIANIKSGETILDPAMGTAGFLRALRRSGSTKTVFHGIEFNIRSLYLACLYKYLLHDNNSLFSYENALTLYS